MSVLLETSLGDIVIDLHTQLAPRSCINFLKLCSQHYYKLNAFFSVERDFSAQTGDPTNTGRGGASIWSQLPSTSRDRLDNSFFHPETQGDQLKHTKKGTVSFACSRKHVKSSADEESGSREELVAGSQFFITLKDEIDYLDGKHAPFGIVVEGQEPGGTLDKINEAFTDDQKRPLKDIRIRHVVVLEDPFPDPDGFVPPSRSPSPTPSQVRALRLADDEDLADDDRDDAQKEESRRNADTNAAALTLEMVGDLPFAEIRPPENILFVCKLNPVTRSDDLELIFSRFGKILSCEVIKDKKTGDSLQYAFIEFDKKDDAERAYFKMQNVLVDDRRIWVDFSQSVSRLHGDWVKKRNGGREAPKGHHKWGVGGGTREDGSTGKMRMDSYRPREDRYQNRGSGDRDGRDDRRQGDRDSRRDSNDGGSSARYDSRRQRDRDRGDDRSRDVPSPPRRDDDRERAHKRSRREEGEQSRSRRDGTSSSHRDGERSSRHQERDSKHSSGRDRMDEETRRRRHDEDRDRQSHRESSSRRHDSSSRSERDDRRDRDRDHDRDRRKKGDRRRDDDRQRHRDGSRR
ncbi:related to Multidomain cyclophilin type peptidyl-prolyl cis-trans isomerase [Ustilago trichophora]|uniref:Peptidyl-prolyl cis-trans isomerase n=1 Tax=Ustilago trichophora TaxID=86804 RepID=A0A5C3ES23_9BASI|nr:related to Multidomain cyclophilin type peptidyl-prolyl cis-trans isomerase [Ustilago trichophora]